jgi:hypothetical protein
VYQFSSSLFPGVIFICFLKSALALLQHHKFPKIYSFLKMWGISYQKNHKRARKTSSCAMIKVLWLNRFLNATERHFEQPKRSQITDLERFCVISLKPATPCLTTFIFRLLLLNWENIFFCHFVTQTRIRKKKNFTFFRRLTFASGAFGMFF